MTHSITPSGNNNQISSQGGSERRLSTHVDAGPTEEARSLAAHLGDFCARIAADYSQIQDASWRMDVPLPDMDTPHITAQLTEHVLAVIRNHQNDPYIAALAHTTKLFQTQDGAHTTHIVRAIHGGIQLDILAERQDAQEDDVSFWMQYVEDTHVSIPPHAIGFWTGVLEPVVNQLSTLAHAMDTVDKYIIQESQELQNMMEENYRRQRRAEQTGAQIDEQLLRAEHAMKQLRHLSPGFREGGVLHKGALDVIARMTRTNLDITEMVHQVLSALESEQTLANLGAATQATQHEAIEGAVRTSQLQAIQSHTRQLWVDLWMSVTSLVVGVATDSRPKAPRLPVQAQSKPNALESNQPQTKGSLRILEGEIKE